MTAHAHTGNVYSLDALRPTLERRRKRSGDRRREPRFICRERMFVQVVLCPEQPELVGRTLTGRVVDVAASGLGFHTELRLPPGALVDIWVDLSSRPGKFFLSGTVRWTRPADPSAHATGVELEEGPATDIDAWRALMQ